MNIPCEDCEHDQVETDYRAEFNEYLCYLCYEYRLDFMDTVDNIP